MKKMLAAYTPLPEVDLARVWKIGLIVLDANVLLNLYGYSSNTRDDLLDGLATAPDRLWLPHQAAAEFHLGRPRVIEQQRTKCGEALKALDQALKAIYSDTSHPFVPPELRTQLEKAQAAVQREVQKARKGLEKMLSKEDPILARVLTLFEGRVGDGPTQEEREALYAEAATRYKYRIPPGFADQEKPDDRKFGDFVLWKQMVRQAADRELPILFVTDDTKSDWWWKPPGKAASVLPALRVEMDQASGQPFQMYEALVFIEEAKARLKWKVKDDTLKEVADNAEVARRAYSVLADALAHTTPEFRAELLRLHTGTISGALGPQILGSTNLPPHVLGNTSLLSTMHPATAYALLTGLGSPAALLYGLNPGPLLSPRPAPTQPPAPPATEGARGG